jgi:hypothetical protein
VIPRPDLLLPSSPSSLEVYQLTTEALPSSHVYMEAQVFCPDSQRLVLHRSSHAHGSDRHDPLHRYLLCDLADGGALAPLTEETGATAPSVSPDGQYLYYFVDQTEVGAGSLALRRVRLDGTSPETLTVIDAPLPGTDLRPSFIYPLSTISSDGRRLALSCFLRDGEREDLPWGLLVFDLEHGTARVAISGNTWTNMHPQYCRSHEIDASHDVMLQHNHGHFFDRDGNRHYSTGARGNDIHVIRDDAPGSAPSLRCFPWGRDAQERQAGHQCWVGRSGTVGISGVHWPEVREGHLVMGHLLPDAGHLGMHTPGGRRNVLSRECDRPYFVHFGVDIAGRRIIVDERPTPERPAGLIYLADLPEDEDAPLANVTPLLDARSSWDKTTHPHPFLSPDGRTGFFNSDESGVLQAYMVRGW